MNQPRMNQPGMNWTCQWCGRPHPVPFTNPVVYVCPACGREAGGVFDPVGPPQIEEDRELVDVRVTWSGSAPNAATMRALRSLDPRLRDQALPALLQTLRGRGYFSLGVHPRVRAHRIAEEARTRGLAVVLKVAG